MKNVTLLLTFGFALSMISATIASELGTKRLASEALNTDDDGNLTPPPTPALQTPPRPQRLSRYHRPSYRRQSPPATPTRQPGLALIPLTPAAQSEHQITNLTQFFAYRYLNLSYIQCKLLALQEVYPPKDRPLLLPSQLRQDEHNA